MEEVQTLESHINVQSVDKSLVRLFPSTFLSGFSIFFILMAIVGCSTKKVMEDNQARFEDINNEFGQVVQIQEAAQPPPSRSEKIKAKKKIVKRKPVKESNGISASAKMEGSGMTVLKHEPSLEDGEGFNGRRPMVDPFIEGETATYTVNYNVLDVEAGELVMQVHPFKMVNGRKAYSFGTAVKSSRKFSLFFALDNSAETNVDYETLAPLTYASQSKETSKFKEVRAYFDWQKNEVTHWEKTIKKKSSGEKKKKIVWNVEPFTQNVISAVFYMRNFVLTPGKTFAFNVADAGKNYVFKGEVLRREKLKTAIGELSTVVVRPTFTLDDQYAPTGENLIWLTDDKRKQIVRIESKVKIGAFLIKIKSVSPAL